LLSLVLLIAPLQEFPERGATMTEARFFFGSELRECLFYLGKIEHRVITESSEALEMVENAAFGESPECCQSMAVTGGGDDADETTGAPFRGNTFELAKDSGVVGIVVSVGVSFVRFLGSISSRMDARGTVEGVDFKAGVVRDDNLTRQSKTVLLGFLAGIIFEVEAIFDNGVQFREVGNRFDLDVVYGGGSGEVAQLAGVGSSDEYFLHLREQLTTEDTEGHRVVLINCKAAIV
jgi:hypothetical protein